MSARTPEHRRLTPQSLLELTPFAGTVGIEFERLDPTEVTARLAWSPERCTVEGIMHGGAQLTLADAAAGVCAYLNLPADAAGTSTIELKSNFLHAVRNGVVTALARPVHVGRTFIVVQTDLVDDAQNLVCRVMQTQAVLR